MSNKDGLFYVHVNHRRVFVTVTIYQRTPTGTRNTVKAFLFSAVFYWSSLRTWLCSHSMFSLSEVIYNVCCLFLLRIISASLVIHDKISSKFRSCSLCCPQTISWNSNENYKGCLSHFSLLKCMSYLGPSFFFQVNRVTD